MRFIDRHKWNVCQFTFFFHSARFISSPSSCSVRFVSFRCMQRTNEKKAMPKMHNARICLNLANYSRSHIFHEQAKMECTTSRRRWNEKWKPNQKKIISKNLSKICRRTIRRMFPTLEISFLQTRLVSFQPVQWRMEFVLFRVFSLRFFFPFVFVERVRSSSDGLLCGAMLYLTKIPALVSIEAIAMNVMVGLIVDQMPSKRNKLFL